MAYNEIRIDVVYNVLVKDRPMKIEGTLDTYDINELPIALTFQVKNIDNIGETAGNYSKTIKLPATQNNNRILQHLHSDSLTEIENLVKDNVSANVWSNGNLVFTGQLLVKAVIKDDKPLSYEVSLIGDNNNWLFDFQNGKMCDTQSLDVATYDNDLGDPFLNWVTGQPIVRQWTDGFWNWINQNVQTSDDFDFTIPLICDGQPENPYTAPAGSTLNGQGAYKATLMEQLPAPFIKSLVYGFFNESGYEVVSDFMETKEFKKLVLLLDRSSFNHDGGGGGDSDGNCQLDAEYEFRYQNGYGHNQEITSNNWWTGADSLAFADYEYNNCYLMPNRADLEMAGTLMSVPFNVVIKDCAKAAKYMSKNDPNHPKPEICAIGRYWGGQGAQGSNMGNNFVQYTPIDTKWAYDNSGGSGASVTDRMNWVQSISPQLGWIKDTPVKTGYMPTPNRDKSLVGYWYPDDEDWFGANHYTSSSGTTGSAHSDFGTEQEWSRNENVFTWQCKASGYYNVSGNIALALGQNTLVYVKIQTKYASASGFSTNDSCPCNYNYVSGAHNGGGAFWFPPPSSGDVSTLASQTISQVSNSTVAQQASWNTYGIPRFDPLFYKEFNIDLPLQWFDYEDEVVVRISSVPWDSQGAQMDAGIAYVLTQDTQKWDVINPCYIIEKVLGNKNAQISYNGIFGLPEHPDVPGLYQSRKTHIKFEKSAGITYGDYFNIGTVLPCDKTKADFISGLTGLFNLHWYTDESAKKVFVEPFSSFYNNPLSGDVVDWTNKVDYHNPHRVEFLIDRLTRFVKYKYVEDGKDGHVGEVSDINAKDWHSITLDFGHGFLPTTKELGTDFFAATYMFNFGQLVQSSAAGPYCPLRLSEYTQDPSNSLLPELGEGFELRILSYEGLQQSDDVFFADWRKSFDETSTDPPTGANSYLGEATEYPAAVSFINNASFTNLDYDDNQTSGQSGLYSRFWKHYIDMLATNPRIKTIKVRLEPHDIAQLDLRKPVYIKEAGHENGHFWLIHKILDYAPHHDSLTDVELIQSAFPDYFVKASMSSQGRYGRLAGITDTEPSTLAETQQKWLTYPKKTDSLGVNSTFVPSTSPDSISYNDQRLASRASTSGFNYGNRTISRDADVVRDASQRPSPSITNRNNNVIFQNNGQIALGNNLISYKNNQIALGQFNKRDDDAILVIGGGTDENNRKNIITVKKDGSIMMGDGGMNIVTKDAAGNITDLYTENDGNTTKVIK